MQLLTYCQPIPQFFLTFPPVNSQIFGVSGFLTFDLRELPGHFVKLHGMGE